MCLYCALSSSTQLSVRWPLFISVFTLQKYQYLKYINATIFPDSLLQFTRVCFTTLLLYLNIRMCDIVRLRCQYEGVAMTLSRLDEKSYNAGTCFPVLSQ